MSRTGQLIVYCSACSVQVRGNEFIKGRAIKINGQVFCKTCRPGETPRVTMSLDSKARSGI